MKGLSKKKYISFEDIFSFVIKMSTIREVLSLTTSLNLDVQYVNTTFLHGDLGEEFYMEHLEGFEVEGK